MTKEFDHMLYIGNLVSECKGEILSEESVCCFLKFWLRPWEDPLLTCCQHCFAYVIGHTVMSSGGEENQRKD